MFTRLSNFSYGNYQIANISATEMNVDTQLLIQIQKYENECLRSLLGEKFFAELMSNLELEDLNWKVKESADEKWDWLVNGCSYLDSGCSDKSKRWDGLVKKVAKIQDTDVFESLTALYVFYRYSLNTRTLNLGVGEGKLKADNTTQESSKYKRIDAWNEFVQWASYGFSNTNVSLYQFLEDHNDIFLDVEFIELKTQNYYDF